ncbi:hypothetical protein [Aliarcobacter butzleri]|uniref:hypothetical protein n=1 Tax=Aliarcobacter butzleri TaxID=28197 RepID=UPI00215B2658|nr:hypothetical protein [Aliarcobacter butzleri]MCR8709843.1 hypothetical protein [Aliarcobacter butzleri]
MTYLDIKLRIFGYGLGFEIKKSDKNYNPNKPNYKNDGSIKKYNFDKWVSKYSDWYFHFSFFYNYSFIFRIYLNRG